MPTSAPGHRKQKMPNRRWCGKFHLHFKYKKQKGTYPPLSTIRAVQSFLLLMAWQSYIQNRTHLRGEFARQVFVHRTARLKSFTQQVTLPGSCCATHLFSAPSPKTIVHSTPHKYQGESRLPLFGMPKVAHLYEGMYCCPHQTRREGRNNNSQI